ncbi:MAG: GNAT family N-acetyltransferase [Kofleriaceae bacterium]
MTLAIRRTDSADPAFTALVRELDTDLWRRYGDVQAQYAPHNTLAAPLGVVLAELAGAAAGCGAMKRFDDRSIELKRMFVAPDHRRAGVGRAVVAALEAWARELGHARVVLETGTLQHEAIGLYERLGFVRIPAFGPYVDLPASVCMAKPL